MTAPPSLLQHFRQPLNLTGEHTWSVVPPQHQLWDHLRKSTIAATPPLPLQRLVRLNPAPSSVPGLFFKRRELSMAGILTVF